VQPNANDIAKFIDHTLLKPEATSSNILKVCEEAKQYKFFGVCVNSCWIPLVAKELKGSSTTAVAVVGFPLGAMASGIKAAEARWCVENGASEVDMVINIGQLKDRNLKYVEEDIHGVVLAAVGAKVKVILETSLLTDEEKVLACELSIKAGAHFVKTSTGFGGGGASAEDIKLMRKTVGPKLGVKASGGVKNAEQSLALIEAGATRIGTSSGVLIVQGLTASGGY
jgi:deoxyribose-phosphate aldolase